MSLSDTGTGKAPQSLVVSSVGEVQCGARHCNPRLYCLIAATLLHCTGLGWILILSSQECQTLAAIIRMTGLSLSGVFLLQSGVITKLAVGIVMLIFSVSWDGPREGRDLSIN